MTIGTKFEHNIYTGWETQPSARLLWTPDSHQTVWAAITRAVRSPSRLDEDLELTSFVGTNPVPVFLTVAGQHQFVSEALQGYEIGYRKLITSRIYLDIALFHNRYDNLTSFGPITVTTETSPAPAHLLATARWTNGLKGTTDGFEIAPVWKAARWLELKPSWSYLNMALSNQAGSSDTVTIAADEGSSPRQKVAVQAFFSLPRKFAFDSTYRYVSALPAQYAAGLPAAYVTAYNTIDIHASRPLSRTVELSISAQNLLQPSHPEFAGDPGSLVAIKRTVFAGLTWRQ